jgi:Histidine kinase-, DNA gyrase B-, and HSP90-like ATPase
MEEQEREKTVSDWKSRMGRREMDGYGYELSFDLVNKILLGRFEGRLCDKSSAQFCHAYRQFTTATNARAVIIDLTAVTEIAISSAFPADQPISQAPAVEEAKSPRIIVGTTVGFDLMCMLHVIGESTRPLLRVVHTMDEAFATLGVQSPQFAPHIERHIEVMNLNALVSKTGTELLRFLRKGIEQRMILEPTLGLIKVNPSEIEQTIRQLVCNAHDAMPNGGQLAIETANATLGEGTLQRGVPVRAGQYVMLAVSDSGVGMDAETQSRVFEPWFTTKEQDEGRGLSLAILWGVVKQNDGYTLVESEPGKGTTIKIYLPKFDAQTDHYSFGPMWCEVAAGTLPYCYDRAKVR